MSVKATRWIFPGVLIGILLGGLLGYQWPQFMRAIGFVGDFFVNVLGFLILPLLLTSVIVGISQLGDRLRLSRAAGKAILYFSVVGILASGIGLVAGSIIRPDAGVLSLFSDLHNNWVPVKIVTLPAWVFTGAVLFSLFFGGALTAFGPRSRSVTNVLGQAHQAMMKAVGSLMYIAPVGLFSLIGSLVAEDDQLRTSIAAIFTDNPSPIGAFVRVAGTYLIAVLVAILVIAAVILPLILKVYGNQRVFQLLRSVYPAIITAFGTSSSLVALPFTYHGITVKQGVDNRAGALVLPMGSILNAGATALCAVVATVFLAHIAGVSLTVLQYLLLLIVPFLLAVGSVGLPSPILVLMLALLVTLDMPSRVAGGLGIILVVDWIVDRFRSALNVWSDSVGTAVVAECFEFKTARTTRVPSRERSPRRTGRPGGRTRGEHPTTVRRRTDSPHGQPNREQKSSRRQTTDRRSPGRSAEKTTTSRKAISATKSAQKPAVGSPFDMSTRGAPQLEMDVTGPATRQVAKGKPVDRESGRGAGKDRPRSEKPKRTPTGHDQAQPPQQGTKHKDLHSETNGRLSPETIAKELKKVSAQQNLSDGTTAGEDGVLLSDKTQHSDNNEATSETNTARPQPMSHTVVAGQEIEKSDQIGPSRDLSGGGDDSEDVITIGSGPDQSGIRELEEVGVTGESPDDKPDTKTYGRSRVRRREPPPRIAEESSPGYDSESSEAKDGFSANSVTSFGRTKRRKAK